MNKFIALFRGVNVGGHNILPMKELADLLTGMKCHNVRTYIQSGNVIFQREITRKDKFAKEIGLKIREINGFEPKILLFDKQEIENVIKNIPFDTKDGKTLHMFFLYAKPENPDIEKLNTLKSDSEEYKLHKRVFYLYAPNGVGRSKLAANVEQCMGIPVTARNWNTVKKLISMINQ